MCMADGADRVLVLGEASPTARKTHRCMECGRTIGPGENYLRERYVSDGDCYTHKTCAHCEVAREWLLEECSGFIYGGIFEDLREHVLEAGHGWPLARMVVGMRRSWRRWDGGLMPVPECPPTTHTRMAAQRDAGAS